MTNTLQVGTPLASAQGAMILLHGRGGTAADILELGRAVAPENWALLAPQAPGNTWYPNSFLAPRKQNEPFLSSALARVKSTVDMALDAGITSKHIVIAGFSQGACLSTEFVGQNPQRWGGLLVFTGGLIGPLNEPITLSGDLAGTPVLLSSGDPDPHVPWVRVEESADLLAGIGGQVIIRRYPGRPHTVSEAELAEARTLLKMIANHEGSEEKRTGSS
jgi:phospholipase/carboxylesterase